MNDWSCTIVNINKIANFKTKKVRCDALSIFFLSNSACIMLDQRAPIVRALYNKGKTNSACIM